jgi:hypothetical protein
MLTYFLFFALFYIPVYLICLVFVGREKAAENMQKKWVMTTVLMLSFFLAHTFNTVDSKQKFKESMYALAEKDRVVTPPAVVAAVESPEVNKEAEKPKMSFHDEIAVLAKQAGYKTLAQQKAEKQLALAEQGNASAQYILGIMYEYGEGVSQDMVQAMYWYRKAAEQGLSDAQFFLGAIYYNGEKGITKDYSQAIFWLRKAAEQGDTHAQEALKRLGQ